MQRFISGMDSCACKAIFGHVKPATAGPVANTYLELKMLYFILPQKVKKMAILSGLQTLIFPLFFLFLYFNAQCQTHLAVH